MRASARQRGVTLVEALVAAFVLVVGALGTVALVSAATDQTSRTLGEESATGLAREVLEVARHVPFASLAEPADAAAGVAPLVPGSGAPSGAQWTVAREGRTFAVSLDACRVAATGAGGCTADPGGDPPAGDPGADAAVLIEALGLAGIDLSGGLPNALCGVLGPRFDLTVLQLAGVDAHTCSRLGAQAALPAGPPRLARVAVTVRWTDRGRDRDARAASLVVDPATMAAPR